METVNSWIGLMMAWTCCATAAGAPLKPLAPRKVLCLDGEWQIAQGDLESVPKDFAHVVPVPGLVDMAMPRFKQVGLKSRLREAFWYRRTFAIDGPIPDVALLRIGKAKYGTRVYLNGVLIGQRLSCFTASQFDVRDHLKGHGAVNRLTVRVGAFRDAVPPRVPSGWDFEKCRYIPGIFDSVELILTGAPYVENVQAVPDLDDETVTVHAEIQKRGWRGEIPVTFALREAASGQLLMRETKLAAAGGSEPRVCVVAKMHVPNCRLWSPDDPHLYRIDVATPRDAVRVRFGMRSFRLDPESGRAVLNGKTIFLRGTNVCIYRFFEDDARGDRPWRKEWVRRLHETFKSTHWNSVRYCIGFPPEIWYEIADEEGLLVQDEYPIWYSGDRKRWPKALTSESLAPEYADWVRERWNHPCVVLWDAQNESRSSGATGNAIRAVRDLDRSGRPWDNGWDPPVAATDSLESHPYFFNDYWKKKGSFTLADLAGNSGRPVPVRGHAHLPNPILVNEYGWLWLNRAGETTCVTKNVYKSLLGENSTVSERRLLYARNLAALTEFWRCHRQCAGVLNFCGLGFSRSGEKPRPEGGATSDHFVDVETLQYEANFEKYVKDAFAPVGLMIDLWKPRLTAGARLQVPVYVINDRDQAWQGSVALVIRRGDARVGRANQPCRVAALGREILNFDVTVPVEPGHYQLVAERSGPGNAPVRSLRDVEVVASLDADP